jgi:hypothetical protein
MLLAGIQQGSGTGPPIKTFGGDAFETNLIAKLGYAAAAGLLIPLSSILDDIGLNV